MNPMIFVRLMRILQNPPSRKMIILWTCIVVTALAIFGFERYFGWPEFLTVNKPSRGIRF